LKIEREEFYGGRRFGRLRSFFGVLTFILMNPSVVLLAIKSRDNDTVAMQVRFRGLHQVALLPILKQFVAYMEGGQTNIDQVKSILGYDPTEGK